MPKKRVAVVPKALLTPPKEVTLPRWGPAVTPVAKTMPAALEKVVVLLGWGACLGITTLLRGMPASAPKAALTAPSVPSSTLVVMPRPTAVLNEVVPMLVG